MCETRIAIASKDRFAGKEKFPSLHHEFYLLHETHVEETSPVKEGRSAFLYQSDINKGLSGNGRAFFVDSKEMNTCNAYCRSDL